VDAVTRMRRVGTTIVLLTGDYSRIAEKLAQKLGVQDFAAEPLHSQRFGIRGVVQLRYLFAQMAVSDLCAHEFAQDVWQSATTKAPRHSGRYPFSSRRNAVPKAVFRAGRPPPAPAI